MSKTYDMVAVDLLLAGDQAGLTKLAAKAKAKLEGCVECPECGSEGPHDDNGGVGYNLSYSCCDCGSCFDAEEG